MATTYQHRTISSRMEFFFVSPYLFLSLSEEGLLSFYVAELLNCKRKENQQPGRGPELFLRAPPPWQGVRWAPGEAAQCTQSPAEPNEHQLPSAPWSRETPGICPEQCSNRNCCSRTLNVCKVCCTWSRKQKNRLKQGLWKHKPASLIHIKSLSNLFLNKGKRKF